MIEHQPYTFKNWGKNIFQPLQHFYQPETEEELIHLIKTHDKVRFVGAGHSWSPLCKTDGILINLDFLNKILQIDKDKKTVTVQAGIRIKELNLLLDKEGLALENMGSIDQQSIIGAISTGTHGTGKNFKILGDQLLELCLIKADGTKLYVNRAKDTDLFNACVVNLGALGCISEVTLQTVDAFNLHDYTTIRNFDEEIENLNTSLENHDHFKLWWLPPSKKVVVYTYQRTQDKKNDSRIRQYLKDEVLSVAVYRSLVGIGKTFKNLIPSFNKFLTLSMKGPLNRIEKSFRVFIVPEPPIHRETEWAFDASRAQEILRAYKEFILKEGIQLQFIQEIRFTKGDDFWLSACHGRDTMWIGLYCFAHEDWEKKLRAFENFAFAHDGRPHWGKEFFATKEHLRTLYPKLDDFCKLRQELDPTGKFENEFIARYF